MGTWGRVTPGGYRNHHPFGRALRRFLLHPKKQWLPGDYGWLDGGCLILCDALVKWGAGSIFPGGTLQRTEKGVPFLDHAFAYSYAPESTARVLIDGDGLQSEEDLRRKMRILKCCEAGELRFENCSKIAIGIPRDRLISKGIAVELQERFGPFRPELLAH